MFSVDCTCRERTDKLLQLFVLILEKSGSGCFLQSRYIAVRGPLVLYYHIDFGTGKEYKRILL